MGFVGIARDEETHEPVPYLESLPADLSRTPVFVLDPMLATGGSMVHTIGLLAARGARRDGGVRRGRAGGDRGVGDMHARGAAGHRGRRRRLNENAYIVPGLGDAGDRQFGPR